MSSKIITTNRQARRDYFVIETHEAGLQLNGCEVKSLRGCQADLKGSFARIENGEVFLYNLHISPYEQGGRFNLEPDRKRKLLFKKKEINYLKVKTSERGFTLVPLSIYFKNRYVKAEIALAKGRQKYDKRQQIIKNTQKREIERALKFKNRD